MCTLSLQEWIPWQRASGQAALLRVALYFSHKGRSTVVSCRIWASSKSGLKKKSSFDIFIISSEIEILNWFLFSKQLFKLLKYMYYISIVENLETFKYHKDNNKNNPLPTINIFYAVIKMGFSIYLALFLQGSISISSVIRYFSFPF